MILSATSIFLKNSPFRGEAADYNFLLSKLIKSYQFILTSRIIPKEERKITKYGKLNKMAPIRS